MAHDLFYRPRSSDSSSRPNPFQESEMISDSACRERIPCRGVQGLCEELVECERKNRDKLNRLYVKCLKKYENSKPEKDNCITIKRKMEKSDRRIDEQKNKEWRLVKTAAAFSTIRFLIDYLMI